jgi:hypothetical protein
MKFCALLLSLLTAMACNPVTESHSKTCTYNDKPVDCSVLEGSNRQASNDLSEFPESIEVIGVVNISREGNKVIYQNDEHFEKVFNGATSTYTCSIDFKKGDYLLVEPAIDFLKLSSPNQQASIKLNRTPNTEIDANDLLLGAFDLYGKIKGQEKLTNRLTFSAYSVEFKTYCYPKLQ